MILSINLNYSQNSFLEIVKICIPAFIGLIPYFAKLYIDEERKNEYKKEQSIKQLIESLQNYYLSTTSCSFSTDSEQKNKDAIKERIYNNRISYRNLLYKVKKYLKKDEFETLEKLKEGLFELDQNILCHLEGKEDIFAPEYDEAQKNYQKALTFLYALI